MKLSVAKSEWFRILTVLAGDQTNTESEDNYIN